MSTAIGGKGEAWDLRSSNALRFTVKICRSFESKVLVTVKRYLDAIEVNLLRLGLGPALIARGPTAAVLGLVVSASTHLFHRMSSP